MRFCILLMCLAACTSVSPTVAPPDASADATDDAKPSNVGADAGSDVALRGDGRVTGSVDHSQLGDVCGPGLPHCPEGKRCVRFMMDPDDPELKNPRCVGLTPCDAITCFYDRRCLSPLTLDDVDSGQTTFFCDKF